MDKVSMYRENTKCIKNLIRYLDSINNAYISVRDGSTEAKKQVERVLKAIKSPTPDVTVASSLLIGSGVTELSKHYTGSEQPVLMLAHSNMKKLSNAMKKTQKELTPACIKYCYDL